MGRRWFKCARFSPGATLGTQAGQAFSLGSVPDRGENGGWYYARNVMYSGRGTFTASTTLVAIGAGNTLQILRNLSINIPGVGPIVESLEGLDLYYLHFLRSGRPPVNQPAAIAAASPAGNATHNLLWTVDFAEPDGSKSSDGEHPVRVFGDVTPDFTVSTAAQIANLGSVASLDFDQWLELVERAELRVPAVTALRFEQKAATDVDVPLAADGAYEALGLTPVSSTAGRTWRTADYNTLGLQFGSDIVWPAQTRQRDIIKIWNQWGADRAASAGVLAFPLDGADNAAHNDEFIPLIYGRDPLGGGEGSHFASGLDVAVPKVRPRVTVDAATIGMRFVRCIRLLHGDWTKTYASRIGIAIPTDDLKSKTASKVRAQTALTDALTPQKE